VVIREESAQILLSLFRTMRVGLALLLKGILDNIKNLLEE